MKRSNRVSSLQPEMAVKRAAEEDDEEKDRPGKKRGRLESRGLGPQPPSHMNSLGGVASAKTRQIVEEKLMELEEQENSELVRLPAGD